MASKPNLWDFIPSSEFKIPAAPTREAARGRTRRVLWWLRHKLFSRAPKNADAPNPTQAVPDTDELEAAAIAPDWRQPADALYDELQSWLDTPESPRPAVRTFVGPPGSGTADLLLALAQKHHLKVLLPPPPHEILDDPDANKHLLQFLDESADATIVIPNLERFYLRHQDGLDLLRSLAERLLTCRRVIVGCDSWAWAYLQHAIGIQALLGTPHTLAPFDANRLDSWLRDNNAPNQIEFRHAGDEKPVFPICSNDDSDKAKDEPPPITTLIKALAAESRGNLGVALALWRASLRTRNPEADDDSTPPADPAHTIYWVKSPIELEPRLDATKILQRHRFVLHTVLLHGGLPQSMLTTLLPGAHEGTRSAIHELLAAQLLQQQDDILHIAPRAYPEVRKELCGEGFLADTF